jgi:hypothetical protein
MAVYTYRQFCYDLTSQFVTPLEPLRRGTGFYLHVVQFGAVLAVLRAGDFEGAPPEGVLRVPQSSTTRNLSGRIAATPRLLSTKAPPNRQQKERD